jgi:hypothetical protein
VLVFTVYSTLQVENGIVEGQWNSVWLGSVPGFPPNIFLFFFLFRWQKQFKTTVFDISAKRMPAAHAEWEMMWMKIDEIDRTENAADDAEEEPRTIRNNKK